MGDWDTKCYKSSSSRKYSCRVFLARTPRHEIIDPIKRVIAADVQIDDFRGPSDIVPSCYNIAKYNQRQLFNKLANKLL